MIVTRSTPRHALRKELHRTLWRRPALPIPSGYRKMLPLASIVVVAGLTCTAALPASAYVFTEAAAPVYQAQAYAAGDFAIPAVQRDAFSIGQYYAVQWPLPVSTTISDGYGYRSCAGC